MEVEKVQNIALKFNNNNNNNSSRILEESSIPKEFIRSENEQPATTTVHGTELQVPTIDFSEVDQHKLVDLISKASEEWGLFQIVNHGIPTQVIQDLQKAGRGFFELPQEEKEVYSKPPPGYKGSEGYSNKLGKNIDTVRPWVDHLFHNIWPPSAVNYHFWPNNPPSYRKANEEYAKYLIGVTEKLMKIWSKGLDLEEHKIREGGGGDDMVYLAKINYYPPCPRPELALGVPAHTDLSLLTILVPNDVAGLQVCRDGLWYNVRYIPNALIIHIGDQLEVLSNGKYKAVLHRTTVNKDKTRMSWPVFIEPPPHHEVGPVPSSSLTTIQPNTRLRSLQITNIVN